MKKTADELRQYLSNRFIKINKDDSKFYAKSMEVAFNYPKEKAYNFLGMREPLDNANDFELYILSSVIEPKIIPTYFSTEEVEYYKKEHWQNKKVEFPLVFSVVPISDRQWIGRISLKELMDFKDARLINYNENTQRTMRHMVKGNREYWQISLNKKSVNEIQALLEKNQFIPNTITLNIPTDSEYFYDEKKKELVITSLDYFDILDGYHRYLALTRCATTDQNFDFTMELRLVSFSEAMANQFIGQEDKRNPMRKADSKYYDQYQIENKVTRNLNESSNIAGMLVKNGGLIDPAIFAEYVKAVFLTEKINEKEINKTTITLSNMIKERINAVTNLNPELLDIKWSRPFMLSLLISIKKYDDGEKIWDCTNKLYKTIKEEKQLLYRTTNRFITEMYNSI